MVAKGFVLLAGLGLSVFGGGASRAGLPEPAPGGRYVHAQVAALEQPIFYNRFESFNPYGAIYALLNDLVDEHGDPLLAWKWQRPGQDGPEAASERSRQEARYQALPPVMDAGLATVAADLQSLKASSGLDASQFSAMANAAFTGGKLEIAADLQIDAEQRARLEATLAKLGSIGPALKSVPMRAKQATGDVLKLAIKAPTVARKAAKEIKGSQIGRAHV